MTERPAGESERIDRPFDPAVLRRARQVAEAYQIVLRVEDGQYVGRALELPTAMGVGRSPNACVKATREMLVTTVAYLLETGQAPPAPEFTPSPIRVARWRDRAAVWARGLLWGVAAVCWVSIIAVAALGAKTVVVAGPFIAALGSVVIVLGGIGRYRWAVVLGVSHLAICVAFVAMVNLARLSPRSAYVPFLCVGVPYVIGLTAATVWASRRVPRQERPWECDGCGYLLVGLSEPRCPECGLGFDPARWAGVEPCGQVGN
jgi:predicted RNase H-like HicB family nuclease